MNIHLTIDLPPEVEARLRLETPELASAIREVFALDLFRRGTLDRPGLSRVLGIERFETLALLKRRGLFEGGLSHEDVLADAEAIGDGGWAV